MLSDAELDEILGRVGSGTSADAFESQHLDFKEPGRDLKKTLGDLADAAVCFANADGGTVVLGVNDKATKRREALVGVEPRYTVESIRRGIFDRTKPAVTAIVEKREEAGIPLMVIEIPAGVAPVANTAGTATRRLGTECRPLRPISREMS